MKIVIDMQGAQASNRFRGIGRYSLSIALAVVKEAQDHEVHLLFNSSFESSIADIKAQFSTYLSEDRFHLFYVNNNVMAVRQEHQEQNVAWQCLREYAIAKINPDVVLLTSFIEGYSDNSVLSIKRYLPIKTAVILYDLIPLIMSDLYLNQNDSFRQWYLDKISELKCADMLLAISDSARQEGIVHIDKVPDDVVSISTDADAFFQASSLNSEQVKATLARLSVAENFIMYTGGIDPRKNIEGLIEAYSKLSDTIKKQHQLVIVCNASDADVARLKQLARDFGVEDGRLRLTGYVSDEDLRLLYQSCHCFVFPSKHEGFGLPALEAMRCGAAVVGARSSSLIEVIGDDRAMFDPNDLDEMKAVLEKACVDAEYLSWLKENSQKQQALFSWGASAKKALSALDVCVQKQETAPDIESENKPTLAYLSPFLPEKSGISNYTSELLPVLSAHYKITIVSDYDGICDPWVREQDCVISIAEFKKQYASFDRVLYHFGNSHFHSAMFALLPEYPGVTVVHDYFLSGVKSHLLHIDDKRYMIEALTDEFGILGIKKLIESETVEDVVWDYAMNYAELQSSKGIIFHSNYSKKLALTSYGLDLDSKIRVIPHLREVRPTQDKTTLKRELGFPDDAFIICSFGFVARTKKNQQLVEAFLQSELVNDERVYLVFVGASTTDPYCLKVVDTIETSGISSRINITGWADDELFEQYLNVADMAVQLRGLSRGETSGTVLDCMSHRIALIVNANGSMAELPTECVAMLEEDFSNDQLTKKMTQLYQDRELSQRLADDAYQFICKQHQPTVCAKQYFDAIEYFYQQYFNPVMDIFDQISDELAGFHDCALKSFAQSVDLTFAPLPHRSRDVIDVSALDGVDADSISKFKVWFQEQVMFAQSQQRVIDLVRFNQKDNQVYLARDWVRKLYPQAKGSWQCEPYNLRSGDRYFIYHPTEVKALSKAVAGFASKYGVSVFAIDEKQSIKEKL